MICADQYHNKS